MLQVHSGARACSPGPSDTGDCSGVGGREGGSSKHTGLSGLHVCVEPRATCSAWHLRLAALVPAGGWRYASAVWPLSAEMLGTQGAVYG